MSYEDSRFALFSEPNAYPSNEVRVNVQTKKIVFSEPYDNWPKHYLNNNFKAPKDKNFNQKNNNFNSLNQPYQNNNINQQNHNQGFGNFFNFQGLMPILSKLIPTDFGGIVKAFSGNKTDFSSLLNNPEIIKNAIGLLSKFTKTKQTKKTNDMIKSTDFEIKNYTKVE